VRMRYAEVLRRGGNVAEARKCFRESIAIFERTRGKTHRETLNATVYLGQLELLDKHPEAAEPLFREALEGFRKTVGPDNTATWNVMGSLATLLTQANKLVEAEELLRAVSTSMKKTLGPEHVACISETKRLAEFLHVQQRFAEAEIEWAGMVKVLEQKQSNPVLTAEIRYGLGGALMMQQKYKVAAPVFAKAYEVLKKHQSELPPSKSTIVKEAAKMTVLAYKLSGDTIKVEEWTEKVKFDWSEEKP